MNTYLLLPSIKPTKKYDVITPSLKVISFGSKGYSDYQVHKDDKQKENYIKRHQVNEDFKNLNSASAWSRYILWGEKTMNKSIKKMEELFNIRIIKII